MEPRRNSILIRLDFSFKTCSPLTYLPRPAGSPIPLSLHSQCQYQYLLINVDVLAYSRRLSFVHENEFGNERHFALRRWRGASVACLPRRFRRCLVNNLNEGAGQSPPIAARQRKSMGSPRVGGSVRRRNPDRSRLHPLQGLFDKINPVFRPGSIVSGYQMVHGVSFITILS